MNISFKLLDVKRDEIPYDLLLLADPSKILIDEYINKGFCYLAFNGMEIVGQFVLIQSYTKTYEIVNISVKEEHQGKGIGKQLIEKAIDQARKLKGNIIEVGTANTSIYQLIFYQKCGFRIVGIDKDFFIRKYEEEIYENGIQCKDMIRLSKEL
ncbi:GNAT family N-acetyltransferase [Paenibacillus sp. HB172176]|uniref:GNAT family N-acetyltransferase n=1 Tax=Paenibacillus sp. HB172176 TaxID=2493690 RepID=UPI0014389078|nr:GNAT family N-acetyltransferase [Paenibacillus sp. HB172176]